MGYAKEDIGDPVVKMVRFYSKTDDIFNEASEITAFKASSIRTPEGQPDFNRLHISTDEKIHLKKYIGKGVLEIYSIMFKMLGEGITETHASIFVNEDITVEAEGVDPFNASGGFIIDNENRYREINLSLLDSKIFDCLVDYVLQRWYWLKNMPDDSAMHMNRFNKTLIEINDLTLSLRTPKA